MGVIDVLLEVTCKNVINTILSCIEHATKGTIYRIGSMPNLQAVRIASGVKRSGSDDIEWGLPTVSDYNYPGKSWMQYRDRPGHVLEAMGWCVEKQKSWTADNPFEDLRSVGKQLRGEIEDSYHMEPVLVRKQDLYGNCAAVLEYPLDWRGEQVWQDSEYVVAAVIKIHFQRDALRRGDRSTKIIKELSRSLGTELLTLHLRENLLRAQREFAQQRLQSCKILAHELRNTLIKFGFVMSAVNAEIGILREEWEIQLRKALPGLEWKGPILDRLNSLVRKRLPLLDGEDAESVQLCNALIAEQQELKCLPLLPVQAEQWVKNRIKPKWLAVQARSGVWDGDREEITGLLDRLNTALRAGANKDLAARVSHLPRDLCEQWSSIAYTAFSAENVSFLGEILQFLDRPDLPVPHKHQIKKLLRSLKVLVEVVPEIEERANSIIYSLKNGGVPEADMVDGCSCEISPLLFGPS
ncbi:MAG: hypothetical protein ABFD98_17520 [Syntrophobacteraceae bacterium]|nr:hypothetical protein [Desulfobacteraceae bacterium]